MTLNILDWTEAYLKYKDTVHKKILKIEKKSNNLICEFTDGSIHNYLCVDDLSYLSPDSLVGVRVSCLNSKNNIEWVIKNWPSIKNSDVIFLFANPKRAMHWSLNPKMHDRISDKSSIKLGLMSLFESIPEV